jgi:phycocyanin-associated rod protein
MLTQSVAGKSSTSSWSSRYFRYEVTGLRQNENTDNNDYQIRLSGSTFITVPYNRMTEAIG